MERKDFISCMIGLGFKVNDDGTVFSDKGRYLGTMYDTQFKFSMYVNIPNIPTPIKSDGYLEYDYIDGIECTNSDVFIVSPDYGGRVGVIQSDGPRSAGLLKTQEKAASPGPGGDYVIEDDSWTALPNLAFYQLNDIFPSLYPNDGTKLYYDVLKETEVVDMGLFGRMERGIIPLDDPAMRIYHDNFERKMRERGYRGTFPPMAVRDDALLFYADKFRRNRFIEWVEAHEWDGKPRMRTWFRDLFGATAPALSPEDEETYLGDVAEAWFIGGIRRMYVETKHDVIPVFLSRQGIGKGNALRYTAGLDEFFIDTSEATDKKASFLESVRGAVVVELSEAVQLHTKNAGGLKGFVSQSCDRYRKPYERREQSFPRHFILASTTNMSDIFTDITGNRRFYPMICDSTKATLKFSVDRTVGQYEVEQLWAEALHRYRHGGVWWISKDTDDIARVMQEFCTTENPSLVTINEWLDGDSYFCKVGSVVSRKDIIDHFTREIENPFSRDEADKMYKVWVNSADKAWDKVSRPVTVTVPGTGRCTSKRGFKRVFGPDERRHVERLGMVETRRSPDDRSENYLDVMRSVCIEHGCVLPGERFPHEGVPESVLHSLVGEGLLYTKVEGDRTVYMIGRLI